MNFGQEIQRAVETRMLREMRGEIADSRNRDGDRKLVETQARLRHELEAFSTARLAGASLTPIQERLRVAIEEGEVRVDAFVDAISRATDGDDTAAVTGELFGYLIGKLFALEARVGALEIALSER